MRTRIILSLLLLFALFSVGVGTTIFYIYKITDDLQSVINLHKVEILRQDLVINTQTVQTHLYTIGTVFGKELDVIVQNVLVLDSSVRNCRGCHHSEDMNGKLDKLIVDVESYKDALSYFITTSANEERLERLRMFAISQGNDLLSEVHSMSTVAGEKLNTSTSNALQGIRNSRIILILTLVLSFFIALTIAVSMTRQITEPVNALVDAVRRIKTGELGYTTRYEGKAEFGELIESFNDMSMTLRESNETVMRYLASLSNLYSLTLTFHSITNEADIYKEVAPGVANLVQAEQCGIIMRHNSEFAHVRPGIGLSEKDMEGLNAPAQDFLRIQSPLRKRALILNDDISESPLFEADRNLGARNLAYIWIKLKGELVGAIRIANKKTGPFTEEDSRLLAILANNVSVAIENARLYQDLLKQMGKVRDSQDQLVQAAKLAAIGELASNVAHEINNPLTSILGYAELMREESDLGVIRQDAGIIEQESLRAREIVHQLLEFSRKRSLTIVETDVNAILKDVIKLLGVQMRDTRIRLDENYGRIPLIEADQNQLKQVFLNLINNAIFAMHEEGALGIATFPSGGNVHIEISDTGHGMPEEVKSRLFEPFFTTKKEKGTGLGLSISYNIINEHNGKIIADSEPGRGTKFTIILPVKSPKIKA